MVTRLHEEEAEQHGLFDWSTRPWELTDKEHHFTLAMLEKIGEVREDLTAEAIQSSNTLSIGRPDCRSSHSLIPSLS